MSTKVSNHAGIVSEFNAFWEKWTDLEIPQQVEQFCTKTVTPLQETLFYLANRNIDAGAINQTQAYDLGEKTAASIYRLNKGSLIIGLEFCSREKILDDEKIRVLAKQALPFLEVVMDSVNEFVTYFIGTLMVKEVLSKTNGVELASQAGEQVLQASLQCFRLGAEFSKNETVSRYVNLQRILSNRGHLEVPTELQNQIFESTTRIYSFFETINLTYFGDENQAISDNIQSQIHLFVPKIIKSSFLVGVEHSLHTTDQQISSGALDLLQLIISPTFRLAIESLTRRQEPPRNDEEKTKELLKDIYRVLLVLASDCYLRGLKHVS